MRHAKFLISAIGAATLLTLSACADDDSATTLQQESERGEWGAFTKTFTDQYFALNPVDAVGQGKHDFDGRLPDWSEDGLAANIAFLKNAKADALAFDPADLSEAERFERDYLIATIDGELFWRESADWPHRNPAYYIGGLSPSTYVTVPYADVETRFRAYTEYLKNVPKAVEQIRANLKTPLPATYVELAIGAFGGYAEYYRGDARKEFSEIDDIDLLAAHDTAAEAAAKAMEELAGYMKAQRSKATADYALGADKFAEMLRATEGVDTSIDELEAIGRADLERNQSALRKACAEFAPGEEITTYIAKAAADKPEGGPVEAARRQLADLKAFVAEKDLVSIPSDEEALVAEAPPYRRSNLAYINIPGAFEKDLPSTYYISPPDPSWPAEKQRAYIPGKADLLFVSVHEVWPGHFLNFLHAKQAKSTFGRIFVGYAFAEGWAHYTEEMMWDAGLGDGDPETHIGQLTNALLRDVRYLSAIGLHTGGMTVDQSRKMFLEEAYQSEGSADQQAARGTYDPAYLNYTMGKLMIRKLREDWIADKGGRKAWKDFHDTFLSFGGPPIPMVRKAMMKEDEAKAVF